MHYRAGTDRVNFWHDMMTRWLLYVCQLPVVHIHIRSSIIQNGMCQVRTNQVLLASVLWEEGANIYIDLADTIN